MPDTAPAGGPPVQAPDGQAPGYQRVRIGELHITALYDGFVPVLVEDLHGAPPVEISGLLAESFMPPGGDSQTAVIAFLVERAGQRVLVDAGSGDSLGPDAGHLLSSLAAAGADPADIDHVLLTHLHPDHAGGLVSSGGEAVFTRALIHAAQADADHWLDTGRAAAATGMQLLAHQTAARALAPYLASGRLQTFSDPGEVIPGVHPVDLGGHTPGHTGYLVGESDDTVVFWGDVIHSHTVQLPRPQISITTDTDESRAVAARRQMLARVSSHRWWVGAAHLPFPGLGHLRRDGATFTWVPVTYTPTT